MRRAVSLLLLSLSLTLATGAADAVPGQMTWTDIGRSGGGPITFTAGPPLCPSGTVRDVGGITGIKMEHTCADGSGTFEFAVIGTGIFHFTPAGTGRYVALRGSGSCSVTQNDDGTFTRPCHALADFDDTPPTARITNLDILRSTRGARIGVSFSMRDNVEANAVSYLLSASVSGHALGHVRGSRPGGSVDTSLRVKLPRRARLISVSLKVSDPLHNARTVTRSVRIHR